MKKVQDIPNTREKSRKSQSVTEWCRMREIRSKALTNVEYLSCGEVETLGYFQLSDMKYDNRNVVTVRVRVSTTVVQLYLI